VVALTPPTVPLFRWQKAVIDVARQRLDPFDGPKSTELLAFAIALSHCGKGTTGTGITLPDVRETFGERWVRRYIGVLTHSGYIVMTVPPARGRYGKDGRRAEYGLTLPPPIAAQLPAQKWAARRGSKVGSVVREPDAGGDAALSTTVPTSEHESDAPTTYLPARMAFTYVKAVA
jgi:hypothetical protein